MELIAPSVVSAHVSHARRVPVRNRFRYGIDYLLLDEAALMGQARPSLFSFGKPNLVSLQPSDHGVGARMGIEGVRRLAGEAGVGGVEHVLLLTHPRYWGYVFNPVSFWFLAGAAGNLRAVLAEVHNTFGDRHGYLCTARNGSDIAHDTWVVAAKRFHVSPFFDVAGEYRFRFFLNEARVGVWIVYHDGNGGGLNTAIVGTRRPFTDRELLRALLRRPLGAARTTALIHWQALRLWRKGVPHRRRPEPPMRSITSMPGMRFSRPLPRAEAVAPRAGDGGASAPEPPDRAARRNSV